MSFQAGEACMPDGPPWSVATGLHALLFPETPSLKLQNPLTWKADPGRAKSGMPLPRTHSRNFCNVSLQSSNALPSPSTNAACPFSGSTPAPVLVVACLESSGRRRLKLGWQARCSLRAAAESSCFFEKRRETADWTEGREAISHDAQSWGGGRGRGRRGNHDMQKRGFITKVFEELSTGNWVHY